MYSLPEVAGFGARYILKRSDLEVETRSGTARHSGVELDMIYFVDVEPNLGQPVSEAFMPGSEFRSRLSALKPQSTTITIWVYPDSFDDFRSLKAEHDNQVLLAKSGLATIQMKQEALAIVRQQLKDAKIVVPQPTLIPADGLQPTYAVTGRTARPSSGWRLAGRHPGCEPGSSSATPQALATNSSMIGGRRSRPPTWHYSSYPRFW